MHKLLNKKWCIPHLMRFNLNIFLIIDFIKQKIINISTNILKYILCDFNK